MPNFLFPAILLTEIRWLNSLLQEYFLPRPFPLEVLPAASPASHLSADFPSRQIPTENFRQTTRYSQKHPLFPFHMPRFYLWNSHL